MKKLLFVAVLLLLVIIVSWVTDGLSISALLRPADRARHKDPNFESSEVKTSTVVQI